MAVLRWMELREEDQPLPEIWLDDEALAEHFERVRAKYATDRDDGEDVGDMVENELTKGIT